MDTHSRRALLASCGGALVATTGCTGFGELSDTDTEEPPRDFIHTGLDEFEIHEVYQDRIEVPLVIDATKPLDPDFDTPSHHEYDWQYYHEFIFLTDSDDRDRLTFLREPEETDEVRETIDSLDFSNESMYIGQRAVDMCTTRSLQTIRFQPDELYFEWCGTDSNPDECKERTKLQILFLRLPEPLDGRTQSIGHRWRRC